MQNPGIKKVPTINFQAVPDKFDRPVKIKDDFKLPPYWYTPDHEDGIRKKQTDWAPVWIRRLVIEL